MTAVEHEAWPSNGADTDVADGAGIAWIDVCAVDRVIPDCGIAVLVGDEPVAVFRLSAFDGGPEEWCAVGHVDPIAGIPVMARGLVGTIGEAPLVVPTVASPLHKQRYNLRTGECLDDPTVDLPTFPVRLHTGRVEVGAPVTPT